jgi:hypothetical protein
VPGGKKIVRGFESDGWCREIDVVDFGVDRRNAGENINELCHGGEVNLAQLVYHRVALGLDPIKICRPRPFVSGAGGKKSKVLIFALSSSSSGAILHDLKSSIQVL